LRLQNQFIEAIYDKKNLEVFSEIKVGKASKQELVQIYRNNLFSNLSNALKITYEAVFNFLGAEKFHEIAAEFIRQNRSQSGNLDDYGENFYEFFAAKNEFFLSDLSKLEWLKQKAYLAKNSEIIDIKALQNVAPEKLFDLKFFLSESVFLMTSNHNLLDKTKQNLPQKRSLYFLVNRFGFEVKAQKISKSEFNFLSSVKENLSLYAIYEKYQIDVQTCLQKYLANGVLSGFVAT
jgi:hypothetical protein